MKVFLSVLVLALAGGGAYYFYFRDHPISWTQGPELASVAKARGSAAAAPAAKKDFKELCSRLQGTMDQIPVNLHEARQLPTYALDVRSKLAPHLQLHSEYTTVTEVCDVIIDADQEFEEDKEKCGLAPVDANSSPQERARLASGPNPAVLQARQTIWNNQRLQADSKVRQLLATLENRQL